MGVTEDDDDLDDEPQDATDQDPVLQLAKDIAAQFVTTGQKREGKQKTQKLALNSTFPLQFLRHKTRL